MTGRFFGADGTSKDPQLDPFSERRVAERLRSALADHAEQVEPAPNSYLTLSTRLEEAGALAPKPSGRPGGRLLAAAAMTLVALGAGAFVVSQGRTGDLNAVGGDGADNATAVTVPADPTTTIIPSTTTVPAEAPATTPTSEAPVTVALSASVVEKVTLPSAVDAATAAADFVHLLGMPGGARFEGDDGAVAMLPLDQGDQPLARISVAGPEDEVVVTSATSDTVQISDVFVDGDELVVLGQAIVFEAVVEVHLVGADGTRIASTWTSVANCCEDLSPFEARLSTFGVGEGFVVAHGDSAGSGVVSPFSAVPVKFDAGADDTTYTVFRIRPDDSDQGLNLRDLPGTDEGIVLATLPPGETGIKRLPVMPALVGDSYWWRVRTTEGIEGWVHSWFLTPDSSNLSDEDLVRAGQDAIATINSAEFEDVHYANLSLRVPVALGWIGDPLTVRGPQLIDGAFWTEASSWSVPEATYGESEKVISLRSLLDPPDSSDTAPIITAGPSPIYGFEQEWVERYFAGTRAVTIVGSDDDGSELRRSMMLFYEAGPTGPRLVGAVASIFVP